MKRLIFLMTLISIVVLTTIFATFTPVQAQNDPSREILVYLVSGVERAPVGKPTRITSAKIQAALARFGISSNDVTPAFPNFNEADTLIITHDGKVISMPNMAKIFKVSVPANVVRDSVINALLKIPEVLFAEPNGTAEKLVIPNDPYFSHQWALQPGGGTGKIQAPEAWDIYTGNVNNIIGIIDSGIDEMTHIPI